MTYDMLSFPFYKIHRLGGIACSLALVVISGMLDLRVNT